jgi:hypothetical protein
MSPGKTRAAALQGHRNIARTTVQRRVFRQAQPAPPKVIATPSLLVYAAARRIDGRRRAIEPE